jgi:UMF1 family MFS transporter
VALWWAVFTIPLLRIVPEPAANTRASVQESILWWQVSAAWVRPSATCAAIRQLFIFLVAFWLYNDSIGTIIKMATIMAPRSASAIRRSSARCS